MRGLEILKGLGCDVRILQMEGAKDPDEYVIKYGSGRFKLLIDQAISLVEFKVKVLKQKGNNYKIEVDLDKTTIGEAMKSFDMDSIQDINITNVPLEDIITTIYQRSK